MKHLIITKFTKIVGLGALLFCMACSSAAHSTHPSHLPLNLESADKIRVGFTLGSEAQEMWGKPRIKLSMEEPGTESWLYCDQEKCSQPRLVLYIDNRTNTVLSVGVTLKNGEPEQDLNKIRDRYPGRVLKREQYLYSYRDYFDIVESYVDTKSGLNITYDRVTKKVSAVTRSVVPLKEAHISQSGDVYPTISKILDREITSDR